MEEQNILIRTAKGASILSTQNLINSIIGLIFFMFFARVVDEVEMGIYGILFIVYTISWRGGSLGLRFAGSHFIAFFYGEGQDRKAVRTIKLILEIAILSGLTICAIQFFSSELLSQWLFGTTSYAYLFKITSIAIFLTIIANIFTGFMQGLQRYQHLAFFRVSSQLIRIIISVMLLLLGFGVAAVFIGYVAFNAILCVLILIFVAYVLMKGNVKVDYANNNHISFRTILKFSIPMMVFQLQLNLSDSIDRFIVLNFLGVKALGMYTVSLTAVTSIIMMFATPVLSSLVPSMSEIYAKDGINKVLRSLKVSSRYVSLIFIPACIGFAVLSPLAIHILAGTKYLEAAIPLSIISIGLATYGFSTILISALLALRKTSKIAISIALASLFELAITVLLVPLLGASGAAISRTLMYMLMFGLLFLFSFRSLKIAFDKIIILKSIVASTVMACILLMITTYYGFILIMTPIYIIIGIISYISTLILLGGISRKDILLLCKVIPGGKELLQALIRIIAKSPFLQRVVKRIVKN